MTDQVDSVNVVLNDTGQIVSQVEFLPFGETWTHEGDVKHNPKYNSQELDKETNYYFYNARHYDPEICSFVTADNQVDGEYNTQGWNRYAYVKNNPVMYKDPTGHTSFIAGLDSLLGGGPEVHSELGPNNGSFPKSNGPKSSDPKKSDPVKAPTTKQDTNQNPIANILQQGKDFLNSIVTTSSRSRIQSPTTGNLGSVVLNHPFDGYIGRDGSLSIPDGLSNHGGVDLRGSLGDPVYSMGNGKVGPVAIFPGKNDVNTVVIKKPNGYTEWYQHVTPSFNTRPGRDVKRGDIIGYLDDSGINHQPNPWWAGGHLHLTIKKNGIPLDPIPYITEMYPGIQWGFMNDHVRNYVRNNHPEDYSNLNKSR